MTERPLSQDMHDEPEPKVFEDGFVNPRFPRLPSGEVDLNEFARQCRDGERREVMTLAEAIANAAESGSLHSVHMVNYSAHPELARPNIDIDAIRRELGIKASK